MVVRRSNALGTVNVGIKRLGGRAIQMREGTTDGEGVVATFAGGFHRAPKGLNSIEVIWDLGANIGLTMADLAVTHPHARITGVELDAANVRLARENVAPWQDRCEILHAAVWSREGTVQVSTSGDPDGHRIAIDGDQTVDAITLTTLYDRTGPVDFVKVDVEGAEKELLRDPGSWISSVKCIMVECHDGYPLAQCVSDLQRAGFATRELPRRPWRRARSAAVGLRSETAWTAGAGRREE